MTPHDLLWNLVEFWDMCEAGGPDDGQADRDFVIELRTKIVPEARRFIETANRPSETRP